jgi:hypothetical protein
MAMRLSATLPERAESRKRMSHGGQRRQVLPAHSEWSQRIEQPSRYGEQHVGPGERINFRHGQNARIADGCRQAAGIPLEEGDTVALFEQIERGGAAHEAAADNSDMRHAVPFGSSCLFVTPGRRRSAKHGRPIAADDRRKPDRCRQSLYRAGSGLFGRSPALQHVPQEGQNEEDRHQAARWSAPARCRSMKLSQMPQKVAL